MAKGMGGLLIIGALVVGGFFLLNMGKGGGAGSNLPAKVPSKRVNIKQKKLRQPSSAAKLAQSWYYPKDDLRLTSS